MGLKPTDIPALTGEATSSELEDDLARKVLRNVDGGRDLKRIAVTCGISDEAVAIIADDLLQQGLIEVTGSSRLEHLGGRPRGRSSGMYSQVTPSERVRQAAAVSNNETATETSAKSKRADARRGEIETAYSKLDRQSYYELLGVSEDAPKSEIRAAYFELSKRFHPDSLFGVELGKHRKMMEAVFGALTDAYDTLGRSKRRTRYNREQGITATPRQELSEQPTTRHKVTGVSSEAPTATFRRLSDEEKRARHQLHTRKLLAVTQQAEGRYRLSSRPSIPVVESPSPRASSKPAAAPRRERTSLPSVDGRISHATRELARSLQETAKTTGGVSRAETYIRDARESADAGDFRGAVNAARLAMGDSPEREDLRELFAQYTEKLQQQVATTTRSQAQAAEKENRWSVAAEAWKACCDASPDDLEAHLHAVEAGLKAGSELPDCKRLAQRAIEIDSTHVGARRLMAKVFIQAGMKLNAKRELKKALALDPNDEISEDMLRTLR